MPIEVVSREWGKTFSYTCRFVRGCDISQVDKTLVFGILLDIYSFHENDIENYREQGQIYLDTIINKSKF